MKKNIHYNKMSEKQKNNTENDNFSELLNYIIITKGEAYSDMFDKYEKKEERINRYREPIINISKSLFDIMPEIKKWNLEKSIETDFSNYNEFQIVNLLFFIAFLSKFFDATENFLNNNEQCKRIDLFYAEETALELKLFALFNGFLERRPEDKRDQMPVHAQEFLRFLADQAELHKHRVTLKEIADMATNRKKNPFTNVTESSEIPQWYKDIQTLNKDKNDESYDKEDFVFKREIDSWKIVYEGVDIPLKGHYQGLIYIQYLLSNPDNEIPVSELRDRVEGKELESNVKNLELQYETHNSDDDFSLEALTIINKYAGKNVISFKTNS